jgi:outer membrane receptor protein involved in Fe transport
MRSNLLRFGSSIGVLAWLALLPPAALAQATGQASPPPPPAGAPVKPGEVVVTGARSEVTASVDRTSFNVSNDLQVQTGTLADALRAVPGVEVDLQGNVSLRGDSGVKILVDGRPSAMFEGDARSTTVLTMPAGQVERVEVITNPSAAFSPEGSAGIINLVRKQARKDTRSGTVRATLGGGGRGGLSLNGTHSGSKLTLTGDVNYRRFAMDTVATSDRELLDSQGAVAGTTTNRTESDFAMNARTGRVGLDYDLDKANRVSSELSYRRFQNQADSESVFTSSDDLSSFDRSAEVDMRNRGWTSRLAWRRALAGKDHELTADLQLERIKLARDVVAVSDFASGSSTSEEINARIERRENKFKAEYKRPLGEEKSLHLGYHGDFNSSAFDFAGARGPSFDDLAPVPSLTNQFDYDEAIHAVFGTYRFRTGKAEALLGLRVEQVDIAIDQITDDARFEQDYLRAYPTLHLGYEVAKNHQLRASYSRRIQRPSPFDLNPYLFYIDPLNVRQGNPFLKPEITDSFEAMWQMRKGPAFYSLTAFYRRSKGGVTDVFSDLGDGVILTTRANLATANRVGVEAVANGKLTKTLTYNASGSFQRHEIDPRTGGVSQPRSGTTGTIRGNLNWQPGAKDFFQLNGFYSGRQLLPQGYRKSGGVLNLGYRRKVNDKLSLLVTAQNILDSARQVTVFDTPTLRERTTQRGMGRIVLFGATYTFGGETGRKRQEPAFEFQQPGAGDVPQ